MKPISIPRLYLRIALLFTGTLLFWSSSARAGGDLITLVTGIQNIAPVTFTSSSGDVLDGCITPGTHRIMRFDFHSRNVGDADIIGGTVPPRPCPVGSICGPVRSGNFIWSDAHNHWHIFEFNNYSLLNTSQAPVSTGFKQAFCLMDFDPWVPNPPPGKYLDCITQGVQPGWQDTYEARLPCQFMNMDGIGDGIYRLVSTTDASRIVYEDRYTNNTTLNAIQISGNTVTPYGGAVVNDSVAGSTVAQIPTVASWGPGREDVFWVDGTGALKHVARQNGGVSGIENLGKPPGVTQLYFANAVSWGPNRVDVFARGNDAKIWHIAWNGAGWQAWEVPPGFPNTDSGPIAVSWGTGRLDIFWILAGRLRHGSWQGTSWGPVDDRVAPAGVTLQASLGAVSWGFGRLDVFATGNDGNLWHHSWGTGGWGGWDSPTLNRPHTGVADAVPAVVSWGTSRLDMFWLTTASTMGHSSWTPSGWGPIEDFGLLPGGHLAASGPSAVAWGPDRLDAFILGSDGQLWHMAWNPGWSGWVGTNGQFNVSTAPVSVSWSAGQFDVFYGNSTNLNLVRAGWW